MEMVFLKENTRKLTAWVKSDLIDLVTEKDLFGIAVCVQALTSVRDRGVDMGFGILEQKDE